MADIFNKTSGCDKPSCVSVRLVEYGTNSRSSLCQVCCSSLSANSHKSMKMD